MEMETFLVFLVLVILGLVFLFVGAAISENKATLSLVSVGVLLFFIGLTVAKEASRGTPATSLNVLIKGRKYDVVATHEKYIIIKSDTDDGLKFIGPLDSSLATGRYVKTVEGLVAIE